MNSQLLTEEHLEDIPRKPAVYRIFSDDETLLCIASSKNNVRNALRYFFRCVQPPYTHRWRDTQATTYVHEEYYLSYPADQLRFDYQVTSTGDEAPELKHRWLEEYREQHRCLPPLSSRG
jgi:hypothetical protein